MRIETFGNSRVEIEPLDLHVHKATTASLNRPTSTLNSSSGSQPASHANLNDPQPSSSPSPPTALITPSTNRQHRHHRPSRAGTMPTCNILRLTLTTWNLPSPPNQPNTHTTRHLAAHTRRRLTAILHRKSGEPRNPVLTNPNTPPKSSDRNPARSPQPSAATGGITIFPLRIKLPHNATQRSMHACMHECMERKSGKRRRIEQLSKLRDPIFLFRNGGIK